MNDITLGYLCGILNTLLIIWIVDILWRIDRMFDEEKQDE